MTDALPARLDGLIVETLPNGVLIVDANGVITFVNPQAERQFGFGAGELIGQSIDVLFPDARGGSQAVPPRDFMAAWSTRPLGTARHLLGRRRDGSSITTEVWLSPLTPDRDTMVIAVVALQEQRESAALQHQALAEHLEFERLVAELSSQFINLPASEVDEAIVTAFQRIGEMLSLDRATFFRIDGRGVADAAISWRRAGTPPPPAPLAVRERFPWVFETLRAGNLLCFSRLDEIPSEPDREGYRALGVRSSVTIPLSVGARVVGAVGFNTLQHERSWPPEVLHRLRVFATAFGNLLAQREAEESLHQALVEVRRLRDQLHAENVYLRAEMRERIGTDQIVGESAAIRRVLEQIDQVAGTGSTVLLLGETGTGKELFATRIHELSTRRARAMVRVNCAAIPPTLMESELFGREKGAFTGALARQVGRFELADQSTIFLDEIGDVPAEVQVKLLRVLEERQIERLGSPRPIKIDTRIIAATHRNLETLTVHGSFREDLYYRLNVFPIHVPPLRERPEDIPLLVWRFVEEFSRSLGKPIQSIAREDMAALTRYSWPGNIRELRNVVERAMIVATSQRLAPVVPTSSAAAARRSERLVDVEVEHIRRVLEHSGWRIRGHGGAAERLGLRPTTLETRMAKLGLKRPARS